MYIFEHILRAGFLAWLFIVFCLVVFNVARGAEIPAPVQKELDKLIEDKLNLEAEYNKKVEDRVAKTAKLVEMAVKREKNDEVKFILELELAKLTGAQAPSKEGSGSDLLSEEGKPAGGETPEQILQRLMSDADRKALKEGELEKKLNGNDGKLKGVFFSITEKNFPNWTPQEYRERVLASNQLVTLMGCTPTGRGCTYGGADHNRNMQTLGWWWVKAAKDEVVLLERLKAVLTFKGFENVKWELNKLIMEWIGEKKEYETSKAKLILVEKLLSRGLDSSDSLKKMKDVLKDSLK